MPRLETQQALRSVQSLPFCYVCGGLFASEDKKDKDHVPAKACFAISDRNFPLLLPTHVHCNGGNKLDDEKLGQFIALRRLQVPAVDRRRLTVRILRSLDGTFQMGGVNNLDVHRAVHRWLGAFHAALYGEPMPAETRFGIETPFPVGVIEKEAVRFVPMKKEMPMFVEVIKQERAGRNLDAICCNNGMLRYECVWDQSDDGAWLCVFALDLYSWADLGEQKHFERRGCAGFYKLPDQSVPSLASRARRAPSVFANASPLDPFSD